MKEPMSNIDEIIHFLCKRVENSTIIKSRIKKKNIKEWLKSLIKSRGKWCCLNLACCLGIEIEQELIDPNIHFELLNKMDFSMARDKPSKLFGEALKKHVGYNLLSPNQSNPTDSISYAKVMTFENYIVFNGSHDEKNEHKQFITSAYTVADYEEFIGDNLPEKIVTSKWTGKNNLVWVTPLEDLKSKIKDNFGASLGTQICNYLGLNYGASGASGSPHLIYAVYPSNINSSVAFHQPTLLQKEWDGTQDFFLSNGNDGTSFGITFNLDCNCTIPAKERIHNGFSGTSLEFGLNKIGIVNIFELNRLKKYNKNKLKEECVRRFNI